MTDVEANRLVEAHIPLAMSMARKNEWSCGIMGLSLDDIQGEAMLALVKASRSYQPDNPLAGTFGAWAMWKIKSRMADLRRTGSNRNRPKSLSRRDGSNTQIPDLSMEPSAEVSRRDMVARARQIMRRLSDRERFVLDARAEGRYLEDIGSELGITKERVRQIERNALEKVAA